MYTNEVAYGGAASVANRYAGFWQRLGGYLIDGLLLAIVRVILRLLLQDAQTLATLVYLVIVFAYFAYFWSSTGQTLGDRVAGVKVVRTDGRLLNPGGGIVRYLGLIVSILAIGLGILWMLWDARKQGWHDKMVDTVVIKV